MRRIKNPNPFRKIATLLIAGVLLLSCKAASADDSASSTRLNEAQAVQIARTFCRKVNNAVTAPGVATYTKLPEINPGSYWQARWEVEFPGQATVDVVDATGIIARYDNDSYYTAASHNNDAPGEAITQQEAIRIAQQALTATEQPEQIKFEHAILFNQNPPRASTHVWTLEWSRSAQGVPYRDQHADVLIDAQTGEIRGLALMFPTQPLTSAVPSLSQQDAMYGAASIIVDQGIEESASHTDTHLEIVRAGPNLKTPRLAWISTFVVDGHWRQVYLDAETGDVLGGGRDNGPAGRGPVVVKASAPLLLKQALKTVRAVYLRQSGKAKPYLKVGFKDHPHQVAVLRKTTNFQAQAPAEKAVQQIVLLGSKGTIGVYSYWPESGLLGTGSDFAVVPAEFKAWVQQKIASAAEAK